MRVLIGGSAREGDLVDLDDEEAHHVRVRRALEGDSVEVRNGVGLTGDGVLVARNGSWGVRVARARTEMPPASTVIAVAAGDRDRFSWMVEKLGELGVTELVPLESARAMTVASRVRPAHLDKLRRRALESVKQSGASWAPGIRELTTMDALARSGAAEASAGRWLADAEGAPPPAEVDGMQIVAVGPEGGFTPEERSGLLDAGWTPVRLSPHTLRFETAAIAAAAWLASARARRTR